jgi:hypothetical protein
MKTFEPVRLNPWREIAIVMLVLMEVSWITPWFRSLTPETYAVNSIRVLIILSVMVLFSHLLVRIMDYLHIKKSIRQGVIVIFLVVCCIIGTKTLLYAHNPISFSELVSRPIHSFTDVKQLIPVEFVVIVAIMIGVWRGISLAQQPIGPSLIKSQFWVGIIMFIAFVFLITFVTGENPGEFFYLFLLASLVGVSVARISVVGMVRGGIENKFNRSWFFGILLAALVVVGLSSFFGNVLANKFNWIGGLFTGLFGLIIILLWAVINPVISFLITIIGNVFNDSQFLKDLGDSFQNLNNLMLGFGEKISKLVSKSGIGNIISRLAPTLRIILLVGTIIAIIAGIVLWLTIKLWKDRNRKNIGNEEKSGIHGGSFLQSLLDILRQGWNRAVNSFEQLTDFKKQRKIRAAARIRQIYIDLLELCESLGQPRPEAVTPLEFLPKIDRLFPGCQPEINMITNAYLDVRYGLLPENKNEITNIEDAWKTLHEVGLERLQEQKHNKNR